jgi:hypothetical protein
MFFLSTGSQGTFFFLLAQARFEAALAAWAPAVRSILAPAVSRSLFNFLRV